MAPGVAPATPAADAAELAGGLRIAVHRLAYALRRPNQADDLSPTRYTALTILAKRGDVRPGDLASDMGVTRPSMTRITDGLLEGGWVTKEPDPEDGRACLLRLTPHGRSVVDRVRREATGDLGRDIAGLDPDAQTRLAEALPALLELADRQLSRLAQT